MQPYGNRLMWLGVYAKYTPNHIKWLPWQHSICLTHL